MIRFLTIATALGLTLCGTAKANIGDGDRLAHLARFDRDVFRSLDHWQLEIDGEEFRHSHPWLYWFDGSDLRYFEHRQFIADAVIPTG